MLIVICGATASGKSGLALEIAQRLNSVNTVIRDDEETQRLCADGRRSTAWQGIILHDVLAATSLSQPTIELCGTETQRCT